MSRTRSDRLNKGARPKRRAAAKSHFFKYQLANNPTRAEEIELKRALQESLRSQQHRRVENTTNVNGKKATNTNNNTSSNNNNNNNKSNDVVIISCTSSSDVSRTQTTNSNSSGSSNESLSIITRSSPLKRTRSSTPLTNHSLLIVNKRSRSSVSPNSSASSPASNITTRNSINQANNNNNIGSNNSFNNNNTSSSSKLPSPNEHKKNKCDTISNRSFKSLNNTTRSSLSTPSPLPSLSTLATTSPRLNNTSTTTTNTNNDNNNFRPAIRTYSRDTRQAAHLYSNGSTPTATRSLHNSVNSSNNKSNLNGSSVNCMSTPCSSQISKSTQTSPDVDDNNLTTIQTSANTTTGNDYKQQEQQANTKKNNVSANGDTLKVSPQQVDEKTLPTQDCQNHYLKFKRESKNYAYVKMTALKVSTSKMPSSTRTHSKKSPQGNLSNGSQSNNSPKVSPKNNGRVETPANRLSTVQNNNTICSEGDGMMDTSSTHPELTFNKGSSKTKTSESVNARSSTEANTSKPVKINKTSTSSASVKRAISLSGTSIDSSKSESINAEDPILPKGFSRGPATNLKMAKKRLPPGSWTLLGVPEEKIIYLRDDEPPRRMICYPAIKHIEGDVIQVRDSVLLRSGARKTDLPYIAKVCAFWEDAETGGIMMSLFWYYRPEHTEEGRKPHHLLDEIFASRHRDVDSVECIEDKCYVLTFNEYCRYRKRCKMEQVNTTWSLADVTIPVSNESYHRRNRIPESDINPELVFCCRQIYDSRTRRLIKNPLINTKYGHI